MLRKLMRWFLPCRTIVTRNHLLIMVSSTTPVIWVKVEATTWRKHHRTQNTTTSRHTSTDRSTSPIPETSPNSSNPKRVRSSAMWYKYMFIYYYATILRLSRFKVSCDSVTNEEAFWKRQKCGKVFFLKKQCGPMVKNIFSQHWSLICFWWIVSVMINY